MRRSTLHAVAAAGLATALVMTPPRALAALTDTEQKIVKAVDAHNAAALALLQQLVDINSGTMNFAGVRQVGDILRAQLAALGFRVRWVEGAAFERAGHLVAEHPGPPGAPKLLLIGHLDTVFETRSPFQKLERLDDSTARGPGVVDMKGGDVIIVFALRALKDAGQLDGMNVVVVLDGDEEHPGTPLPEARRALAEAAKGARAAIGFEDGAGDPRTLVIARRGVARWRVVSSGTPAHSSQIFTDKVGAGAIFEAARVVSELYQKLSAEQYLTLNPGVAVGGTSATLDTTGSAGSAEGKSNVVAAHMELTGDLRTLSPEQLARAMSTMRDIVSRPLPQTHSEIFFEESYPPMAPTDGNKRLLGMYDSASRDLQTGPVEALDPSRAGAADVSFIAGEVPMVVDGAGLSGHGDHTEQETADLRMLPVQTKRAAVLLMRLSKALRSPSR